MNDQPRPEADILFIHPDPEQVRELEAALETAGLRVTWVEDVEQGLASALENQPDLILLEGEQDCQRFRNEDRFGDTPIVGLVDNSPESVQELILSGATDFISGESTPEAASEKLQQILSRKGLAALEDSRELFQLLYEHAPDGMYLNDFRGVFLDGNLAAEEITGYSRDELIGKSFLDLKLLNPPDLIRAVRLLAANALGKSTGPDDFELIRKDGSRVQVEISTYPLEHQGHRMILGVARDISSRLEAVQLLSESENRYRSLFQDSALSLWEEDWSGVADYFEELRGQGVIDFRTYLLDHPEAVEKCISLIKIQEVNQATLEMHGAESREQLLDNLDQVFTGAPIDKFALELAAVAEGETSFQYETTHSTLQGEMINIFLRLNIPPEHRDTLDKVIISMFDITKRVELEKEVTAREEYLAGVLKSAPDAILTIDEHHRVRDWNPGAVHLFGYSPEEAVGRDIDDLITVEGSEQRENAARFTRMVARGESIPPTEVVRIGKDGRNLNVVMTASPIIIEGEVRGSVAVYTDVSELAAAREKIRHLANHDPLTGLPNRRLFEEQFSQTLKLADRNELPLAVILLDLDGFKSINDTFGHQVGDQVLITTGRRLKDLLRESDMISRWGGDEFTVLLFNLPRPGDVEIVVNKIAARISEPIQVEGQWLDVKASFGVANYPEDGSTTEELLASADRAMYQAKGAGGDTFRTYGRGAL